MHTLVMDGNALSSAARKGRDVNPVGAKDAVVVRAKMGEAPAEPPKDVSFWDQSDSHVPSFACPEDRRGVRPSDRREVHGVGPSAWRDGVQKANMLYRSAIPGMYIKLEAS